MNVRNFPKVIKLNTPGKPFGDVVIVCDGWISHMLHIKRLLFLPNGGLYKYILTYLCEQVTYLCLSMWNLLTYILHRYTSPSMTPESTRI